MVGLPQLLVLIFCAACIFGLVDVAQAQNQKQIKSDPSLSHTHTLYLYYYNYYLKG